MLRMVLLVGLGLVASTAQARSARLLAPEDVPATGAPAVTPAAPAPSVTPAPDAPVRPQPMSFVGVAGLAVVGGVVSTPLGLWLSSIIGSLSNNLIAALLPTVLVMGFFGPTVTALVAWMAANFRMPEGGRVGFWVPWLVASGVNILALVVGGFLGLSIGLPGGVLLFGLIDGVAMGLAASGMQLVGGRPMRPALTMNSHNPGEPPVQYVAMTEARF